MLFEGNLEEFLLPFIVNEEELQTLIADPGGTRWKDPYLDDKLKERLPRSYDLYLDTITEINEIMEELKRELVVDKVNFQSELAIQYVCVTKEQCSQFLPLKTPRGSPTLS